MGTAPVSSAATAATIACRCLVLRDAVKHRGGVRAFGHRAAVGHQGGSVTALPDGLAKREIAAVRRRAGQDQVAQTRQAGECFAPRAHRQSKTRHFGKAARDERGARIVAKAAPFDHRSNGEDFSDRAADLCPGDVVGQYMRNRAVASAGAALANS